MLENLNMGGIPVPLMFAIIAWSMIWKGIGLWKAGRNNQFIWFIAMFLINSVGILPIIYILFFQKNKAILVLPKFKLKKTKKK